MVKILQISMEMTVRYNLTFVVLSVVVAIFASHVALEFARVVTQAQGRARALWLSCGAVAMGIGIWSMHFVGMLACEMPGMEMAYDVPLMLLSIGIAIGASGLALFIVSRPVVKPLSIAAGGCAMAVAIAGMHYTGMWSMRMAARIEWNYLLVALSVVIALVASFSALFISIRIRNQHEQSSLQVVAAVVMGFAIAGMHYTGMFAATFVHTPSLAIDGADLSATSGLGAGILGGTALILGLALASSAVERALSARSRRAEEITGLYRQAEKALSDLQQERDLRDRFMSALAHDLRTPLSAAKMSAQLGLRYSSDHELVAKHYSKVEENLSRMDGMIEDLLDAHRISAGQSIPLQPTDCELDSFLTSILENLATVHGQRFQLRGETQVRVKWDTKSIRRALENLCNNAVKYGRPNSPITISVKTESHQVLLTVHNEGVPISEAEQSRLFALFQRGQTAEQSGGKGWGLGLTIVKGMAVAHGGTVKVESGPNGTQFTLVIPGSVTTAASSPRRPSAPSARPPEATI